MKKIYLFAMMLATVTTQAQTNFEDISLSTYFDGSDLSGKNDGLGNYTSTYTENSLSFNTTWDNTYEYWSGGWAFSNLTDSSLTKASQTYHSYSTGTDSRENFAIGKSGSEITVNGTATFSTIEVSNNSYAAYSMTNGDNFSKQFTGDDWFELTVEGFNNETSTGIVKVMLADSLDSVPMILETWQTVDLSSLGEVSKLTFTLNSSDVGDYGMNTPSFFAMDNILYSKITFISEPRTDFEDILLSTYFDGSDLSGTNDGSGKYTSTHNENSLSFITTWDNTYKYWSGGWAFSNLTDSSLTKASQTYHSYSTGTDSRENFAIGKSGSEIIVDGTVTFSTIEVSNNSYAAYSMTNGDNFAKQFTGDDWFELTVEGFNNDTSTGIVKVMLADSLDSVPMISETWQTVDISSLGEVSKLTFTLNSSDVGDYGMNTPSFFAMDNIMYSKITFISEPITDFEDISLLPYFDGSDLSGKNDGSGNYTSIYTENNLSFNTTWDNTYEYWSSGWAFSNLTDSSLTKASQTYHSYSTGTDSRENFAIGKSGSEITVNGTATFSTIEVSNNSYAAYSMTNGDNFSKQFTGDDWFELTVEGFNDEISTGTVKIMLADSLDSAPMILETWQTVDLSSLGEVSKLAFTLNSSDVGNYGMNTPSFFAVDNIIFEFTNSLNNLKNTNLFVYPNPATTTVNIPSNIESIDIYSINGNLVLKEFSPSNSIDISFLTQGVYMLKAKSGGAISTTRLIIK